MASASFKVFYYLNGKQVRESKSLEVMMKSIAVTSDGGTTVLTISESSGKFSFGSKVLSGIVGGTASGEALTYDQRGANNGVASLDSAGKLPLAQMHNTTMHYKSTWNVNTNVPALADGAGNLDIDIGNIYKVTTGGTRNLGSGNITFVTGDYAILNDSKIWELAHSGADAVISVNGQTSVVVLDTDDVSDTTATNKYFTANAAKAAAVYNGITEDVTDVAPSQGAVFDALALKEDASAVAGHAKSAAVYNGITEDVTDVAPSQDAVFNALAGKSDTGHGHTAANISDFNDVVNGLIGEAQGGVTTLSLMNKETSAITIRKFVKMLVSGEVTLLKTTDEITDETFFGCVKDATIAADASGNVYMPDMGTLIDGFSALDITKLVYASAETAGGYTQTRPTTGKLIVLGRAVSTTKMLYLGRYEHDFGTEIIPISGDGGTPGGTPSQTMDGGTPGGTFSDTIDGGGP